MDDGTLQHKDVSEATRASTEHMASLVSMGLFNPDFLTLNNNQASEEFASGISGGLVHNLASGYDLWGQRVRDLIEGADVVQIDPVKAEGFTAATWLRPGFNTATQIRYDYADDETKLWDLLRVLDFWFDPATWDFVDFGFEGEDHTVGEDGALTQTDKGSADIAWIRAWSPRHVLKYVDAPYVKPATKQKVIEDTERLKKIAVADPTWGIFPELGFEDPSSTLQEFANNTVGRMVTGEQSLDEWDSYVEEWYNRGGQLLTDTMSALYQQYKA
jgi:putative aldouronate transport system substrate-binding protein